MLYVSDPPHKGAHTNKRTALLLLSYFVRLSSTSRKSVAVGLHVCYEKGGQFASHGMLSRSQSASEVQSGEHGSSWDVL